MSAPLSDLDWRVQNDTVMGGVSTGSITKTDAGVRFTGELSLESNGGFVSIRTAPQELGLDEASAFTVRLRGDGRTWSLNAYRSDVQLRAGSYRASLTTVAGEVVEVTVPLTAFSPTSFGRPVEGAPTLDTHPGRIDQVGFLLADKNPGPFSLEVLSIEAVSERRAPVSDKSVVATLAVAVSQGVPAFNNGDPAACASIYRAALEPLATSAALTDGEQFVVASALKTSATQSADAAAWTLRRALDVVSAGLSRR